MTKRFEFDAAHRLPLHQGKCKHLHGHRYAVEVEIAAETDGQGMVTDFGAVKAIVGRWIDEKWDHATIVVESDAVLLEFLQRIGSRYYVMHERHCQPTAELMAIELYEQCADRLCRPGAPTGAKVTAVTVYETPTSSARYEP